MSRRTLHSELLAVHEATVLTGPGVASIDQRVAAAAGKGEGALGDYARQVQQAAYKVTPEQLAALQQQHADDVLFEVTVAAALGEARRRHDAALAALDAAWSEA